MRILVVHNAYRSGSPSGENQAVESQVSLLRAAGFEIETYARSSDEIAEFSPAKKIGLAIRPLYSFEDTSLFGRALDRFEPDIVHLHNPYPLISPAVISVAKRRHVPVVQSVHNYRRVCVVGTFFRDGRPCEDCRDRTIPWPAVRHGCYRDSRLQSIPMAAAMMLHRRTFAQVDRFLPVSDYIAEFLISVSVPPGSITVVHNSVEDPGAPEPLGEGFLFAGRLDPYKGIRLLLDAWERSGLGEVTTLTLVGDGPERPTVEQAAARARGVRYEGPVPLHRVRELMAASRVVVAPSKLYEALPTVVLEAFATGRPVLASRIGAYIPLVTPDVGWLAEPEEAALSSALITAHSDVAVSQLGRAARRKYDAEFTPQRFVSRLGEVYAEIAPTAATPVQSGSGGGSK
jgi:glycosyltransferase involved in cell wall biosynthesis